jgi:hypothetical protein
MRAFLKLSIAAAAIALLVAGSAFAGTVENGSDSKVTVGGIVWAGIGYVTPFEDAAGNVQTSQFDVNNETRLNVTWAAGPLTGHWEYWMRNDIGRNNNFDGDGDGTGDTHLNDADGDEIMGWVSWAPNESMQLDVGQLEDQSWMERSVDWDMHAGTMYMPGATPGAYKGFPEDTPGLDFTFKADAIRAGLAVYAAGVVSGAGNNNRNSTAQTYIVHAEFKSDFMWIAAYLQSESVSTAGTATVDGGPGPDGIPGNADDPDDTTSTDWGSSTDTANSLIGVSTKFDLGVGVLKVQFLSLSGDYWDDKVAADGSVGVDPPTDIAFAYIHNLGDDKVSIEYDMADNSTTDDKGEQAAATWLRVAYKMHLGTNADLQVEYAMSDNSVSTASRPAVTWIASY